MAGQSELIKCFRDTQDYLKTDGILKAAVALGRDNTVLYRADEYPDISSEAERSGKITVSRHKTFEAAMLLRKEYQDKKITVLNFASAVNPGGGVKFGARAQEESLCRCSTLYTALDRKWLWDKYYGPNRNAGDPRNTDDCIYTPRVVICKTDDDLPERLDPPDFVTVDVMTCAAPDLRDIYVSDRELYELHLKRAAHILHIAAYNETDILVLGAFGCGAFLNDPFIVAKAYKEVLQKYGGFFDLIEFAIYCRAYETKNYKAFAEMLGD